MEGDGQLLSCGVAFRLNLVIIITIIIIVTIFKCPSPDRHEISVSSKSNSKRNFKRNTRKYDVNIEYQVAVTHSYEEMER